MSTEEADVLVIGGGPVGLTMAAELSYRGIKTILLEKKTTTSVIAKAFALNSRSVEHFRRLGLQQKLEEHGYPSDMHLNIVVGTSMTKGHIIANIKFNSRDEINEDSTNKTFPLFDPRSSLALPIFCPQTVTEPVIREHLETTSEVVKMHWGVEVTSLEQDESSVTIKAMKANESASKEMTFKAKYLVACDGGSSPVRKALGVHTFGQFVIAKACSITFRSTELYNLTRKEDIAGFFMLMNANFPGVLYLINSRGEYALHVILPKSTPDEVMNKYAEDPEKAVEIAIGKGVSFTVIAAMAYNMHGLMSTTFREGRCFLAGDSAHQWLPAGGLGLNTGVNDVADLSWKLEAVLKGYGGPHLLDSYQIERRPIDYSSRNYAMFLGRNVILDRSLRMLRFVVSNPITRALMKTALVPNIQGLFTEGYDIILGFQYSNSNIIMHQYDKHGNVVRRPGSVKKFDAYSLPGCRAPHIALPDCDTIHDLLGKQFVILIVGGEETNLEALQEEMKTRGVPFKVYAYPRLPELVKLYDRKFFLIRPDGVIAWRADYQPNTAEAKRIISTVLGDFKPKRLPQPISRYRDLPNHIRSFCKDLLVRRGAKFLLSNYTDLSLLQAGAVSFGILMFLRALRMRYPSPNMLTSSRHRAAIISKFGGDFSVIPDKVGEFGPNDVLIRVRAASVNPIDVRMKQGYGSSLLQKWSKFSRKQFFPLILGRDCSGEVVAVGENVTKFLPGDLVYAAVPPIRQGTYTQLVAVDAKDVSFKPSNIDHKEAASIPWVAVSAWTALVKLAGLNKHNARGKKVLVHAGTGGVGSFAVQLLKAWGAEVATTCSTNNIALAHYLGADTAVDYTTGEFTTVLKDYDVVLDLIGFGYEKKSLRILKWFGGATYVTLLAPKLFLMDKLGGFLGGLVYSWLYRYKVITNRFFYGRSFYYSVAETDGQALEEVRSMVEKGEIRPLIDAVYSMDEIVDAHKHVEGGHTRGKVVISVP